MAMASCSEAQKALQSVAQRLQWTYSLLWQLCPHQGALEWAEGHYNGAIKTRKTVQAAAAAPAEAAVDQEAHYRSRQLRELYDSLAREAEGGGGQSAGVARRPSAALSPEDLTETEWFFLMSASYSFPPGVGLPGKAFSRRGHLWLTGANEVDSKVFSRAILAKSAGIQTVVCIPIVDGVLEIGTIEKVEEDIVLIQYARCIFMDQHDIQMMPTISEHSTSNPIAHIDQQSFQTQRKIYIGQTKVEPNKLNLEGKNNEMEDDDEINEEFASGSETNTEKNYCQDAPLNIVSSDQRTPNAGSSELMQLEMSERVRDGCSNNLDDEIQMLMVCQNSNGQSSMQGQDGPCQSWHFPYEDLCGGQPQWSAAEDQATSPENAHYSETVLTILHHNARRQSASNTTTYLAVSHQSSFSRWSNKGTNLEGMITEGTPQRMLKSILFNAPSSHCKYREAQSPEPTDGEGAGGLQRGAVQGDFSANHVLKERRRREKLNERFIILRSLVPFVTKMDKASILGDAIEYVKQLRKRIHDLESRTRQITEGNLRQPATSKEKCVHNTSGYVTRASAANQHTTLLDKRKLRAVEGTSSSRSTGKPAAVAVHSSLGTDVQVSIIESDALLELRCPNRDGLLLQIMQALQELQLDVTSVQASSADGVLVAELRAMVKEVHGRSSSITEVKRAIHLILSSV